jgi:ketosteroid isomerase-like protein
MSATEDTPVTGASDEAAIPAEDAVARYLAASEANDIDALMATFTPDAELVSPISGRMVFRGTHDVRTLARAVYGSLHGLRWQSQIGDGATRAVVGAGSVGPRVRFTDAMVFELDGAGRIARVRPHIRPWLGLSTFALVLGAKMARHPGIILRALRAGLR